MSHNLIFNRTRDSSPTQRNPNPNETLKPNSGTLTVRGNSGNPNSKRNQWRRGEAFVCERWDKFGRVSWEENRLVVVFIYAGI
eukprot:1380564-Amorphochlora_amoeboformis.AAC.1